MTGQAFTTAELASMHLTGWPSSRQGFEKIVKREGWPRRERQASGGGFEYPVETLPQDLQIAIRRASLATSSLPAVAQAREVMADLPDRSKFSARIVILQAFKMYRRDMGLPLFKAEVAFLTLYAAHDQNLVPSWVYDEIPSLSVSSLRRWRSEAAQHGTEALKDRYGNRKGQSLLARANGGAVARAIIEIITNAQLLNVGHIRDLIRIDFGTTLEVDDREVPLPSYRAFVNFVDGWKRDNPALFERAVDPDGWRNKFMVAVGKADAGIVRLNQRWEIDASPVDVMCKDGRYLVYGVIDVWSRRVLFHVSKTATTIGSLTALGKAMTKWGVPESVKMDNGSDFTSKLFQDAMAQLEIEPVPAGPFQPWKKAFIERVIGTFQHNFAVTQPGAVGHDVATRKKIEGVKSFADNLGAEDAARFNVKMTGEELQEAITLWVDGKYHQTTHGTLKMSPFAKAASWTEPVRMIRNERTLDVLFAPIHGTRKVTKEGIRVEGGEFMHGALTPFIGKEVFVRSNPDDMGRIWVYTLEREFICEAVNLDRDGISRKAVAKASKDKQREETNAAFADIRKSARKNYSPGKVAEKMKLDQLRAKVREFPKQAEAYVTQGLSEAEKSITRDKAPIHRSAEKEQAIQAALVRMDERKPILRPKTRIEEIRENYARYMELNARKEAGAALSPEELLWLENASKSSWIKTAERNKDILLRDNRV